MTETLFSYQLGQLRVVKTVRPKMEGVSIVSASRKCICYEREKEQKHKVGPCFAKKVRQSGERNSSPMRLLFRSTSDVQLSICCKLRNTSSTHKNTTQYEQR